MKSLAPVIELATPLIDAFLAGKKPNTARAYRIDLDRFARWLDPSTDSIEATIESFLALSLGEAHAKASAYRNMMIDAGTSSSKINRSLAAVNSYVEHAMRSGRVGWRLGVDTVPNEPRRDVRGPDYQDFRKLWRCVKNAGDGQKARRDRLLVALAYGLALRRGEINGLDYADVDFASGSLLVLRKGKREKQRMSMPDTILRLVTEWIAARGTWPGPLFIGLDVYDNRKRMRPDTINDIFKALARSAGLSRPVRPHGLRHAAITAAIARREKIADVARFSGHARIETVMRYVDTFEDTAGRIAKGNALDLN